MAVLRKSRLCVGEQLKDRKRRRCQEDDDKDLFPEPPKKTMKTYDGFDWRNYLEITKRGRPTKDTAQQHINSPSITSVTSESLASTDVVQEPQPVNQEPQDINPGVTTRSTALKTRGKYGERKKQCPICDAKVTAKGLRRHAGTAHSYCVACRVFYGGGPDGQGRGKRTGKDSTRHQCPESYWIWCPVSVTTTIPGTDSAGTGSAAQIKDKDKDNHDQPSQGAGNPAIPDWQHTAQFGLVPVLKFKNGVDGMKTYPPNIFTKLVMPNTVHR
jgi:hypothetical protein